MPCARIFNRMMMIDVQKLMSHVATCATLVIGLGCGDPGGNTGTSGESTAASTTETSQTTTTSTTSTGALTESGGSGGLTEGSSSATTQEGTTGTTSTGTTSTGSTTAEPGSTSSGGETSSTGSSSGGGGVCDDFEQPGCVDKGCPEGQKCDTNVGCVPSVCGCDPETGDVICSADCGGGTCVDGVECAPVACDLFCEFGFKTDEEGCEICECNEPPACGCAVDSDCVKTSPGCCSCNMGGNEVAIAKACIDQLEPCPIPPEEVLCPAVYKCTDAKAVCSQGQCVLQ